jgi:hypothetical protein
MRGGVDYTEAKRRTKMSTDETPTPIHSLISPLIKEIVTVVNRHWQLPQELVATLENAGLLKHAAPAGWRTIPAEHLFLQYDFSEAGVRHRGVVSFNDKRSVVRLVQYSPIGRELRPTQRSQNTVIVRTEDVLRRLGIS